VATQEHRRSWTWPIDKALAFVGRVPASLRTRRPGLAAQGGFAAVLTVTFLAFSALVAAPQSFAYGYSYSYRIGSTPDSADTVFSYVNTHFNTTFPFAGKCGSHLEVGKKCDLVGGGKGNVKVMEVGSRHFVFLSQKGHAEGANKRINFTFEKRGNDLYLVVKASGKDDLLQQVPGAKRANNVFVKAAWENFATNVSNLISYGVIK
jgi:hypothetical protein